MSNPLDTLSYVEGGVRYQIEIPQQKESDVATDPQEWLEDGKKPTIEIMRTEKSLSELCQIFMAQRSKVNVIPVELVNVLLYKLAVKHLAVNIEKNFLFKKDITIRSGKTDLNALFLVKLFDYSLPEELLSDANVRTSELLVLASILSNYRIAGLPPNVNPAYRDDVIKKLNEAFKAVKASDGDIDENFMTVSTWVNDSTFKKMCAGIDLLLMRDKSHQYSQMRKATMSARNKDCAILEEMDLYYSTVGVRAGKAWKHSLDANASLELIAVCKMAKKVGVSDVTAYLKEMGAIDKSPFSATVSPNLHNWIHMVSALLGTPRSMRARLVGDRTNSVFKAALACAYTLKSRGNWSSMFHDNNQEEIEAVENFAKGGSTDMGWLTTLSNLDSIREESSAYDEIKEWFNEVKKIQPTDRKGTIGYFLATQVL